MTRRQSAHPILVNEHRGFRVGARLGYGPGDLRLRVGHG